MSTNYYISGSIMAETHKGYLSKNYLITKKVNKIVKRVIEKYCQKYGIDTTNVPLTILPYVTDTVTWRDQDDAGNLHNRYGEVIISLSGTIINRPVDISHVEKLLDMILNALVESRMYILSGSIHFASSSTDKPSRSYHIGITDKIKGFHKIILINKGE